MLRSIQYSFILLLSALVLLACSKPEVNEEIKSKVDAPELSESKTECG